MKTLAAGLLFERMDSLGGRRLPFAFITDAFAESGIIFPLEDACPHLWFRTARYNNIPQGSRVPVLKAWDPSPVSFPAYASGFRTVMDHIRHGDTFLLNYTQPTRVKTNLSLEDIFYLGHARYTIHLRNGFTCFTPEPFVTISEDGIIASHPMKGTAIGSDRDAEALLLANRKETAEHHTIVDLIRNDLSRVADQVEVEKFRYTERINTNQGVLIQVSSKITGRLAAGWHSRLGSIFRELLPAGSVTGAPKQRTIEIIRKAEQYERGWYTGIFGVYDGQCVDSAVLIRYVEQEGETLVFKSGGGITSQSSCEKEYEEMIGKVYVPLA